MDDLRNIPVSMLVESTLPLRPVRYTSIEYTELVDSIRAEGVLQPLLVRPRGDKFEVVEGGYRFAASKEAGRSTVPCLVRTLDDSEVLSLQLQANAVRPPTERIEFADRLHWLMEEKNLSLPQLAALVHKSPDWLRNTLSLRSLNREAKLMVERGEIGVTAAIALARLPIKMQAEYTQAAVTLPLADFVELTRRALKRFREWVSTGKLDQRLLKEHEPVAWLRQMKELRDEAVNGTNAGTVIKMMGATTAQDGWRACLAWVLHLDPVSVRNQLDKQERDRYEKLSAATRRKADRTLKDSLLQIKDFKNEQ